MRNVNHKHSWLLAVFLATSSVHAQVPADGSGNVYSANVSGASIEEFGFEHIPRLGGRDLEALVGPIALYPDPLLAVVLPAAAYPLQVVQAARFLEELETDPSATPPAEWDESVIALLNYPDVLLQLNEDLDWTLQLGEAFLAQQADVLAAIQRFRDRAYAAGNLRSDSHQRVLHDDSIIEIDPVDEHVLYVPVYEPERVVIANPVYPVYSYRPEPYPVYYYPYPDGWAFRSGYFWGVTTAFALGWNTHNVHVIHHSYPAHPYYGSSYGWRWWYRRPPLAYHNNRYYHRERQPSRVRNRVGDIWMPRHGYRTRYTNDRTARTSSGYAERRARLESDRVRVPAATTQRSQRQGASRDETFVREYRRSQSRYGNRTPSANRASPPTQRRSERSRQSSGQVAGTSVSPSRSPTYRQTPAARSSERAPRYQRREPMRQSIPKQSSRPKTVRQAPRQDSAAPRTQSRSRSSGETSRPQTRQRSSSHRGDGAQRRRDRHRGG